MFDEAVLSASRRATGFTPLRPSCSRSIRLWALTVCGRL